MVLEKQKERRKMGRSAFTKATTKKYFCEYRTTQWNT